MEYALRQTLVADAVSLQFRLPPPGVPAPVPRRSSAIAGGTPVVDTLVITSVWAVHLLRSLSQVRGNSLWGPSPAQQGFITALTSRQCVKGLSCSFYSSWQGHAWLRDLSQPHAYHKLSDSCHLADTAPQVTSYVADKSMCMGRKS